jgi:glutamate N-acetyltransferase/amino-acid N-acetyltransferase
MLKKPMLGIHRVANITVFALPVMQKSQFTIHCDIGIGEGSFTAYGCDLGHEYVKINADYRT